MDREEGLVMKGIHGSIVVAIALTAIGAQGCPPAPLPPAPDSGDAGTTDASQPDDIYGKACTALAKAGCSEGTKPNCHDAMKHAEESRIAEMHPDCLAKCTSKTSCRACAKSISCE